MAHLRERYLKNLLNKACTFSPLVGVLGHRQVGKTTLLEQFSKDYQSLDVKKIRDQARLSPDEFVEGLRGHKTVIDEAQLAPDLFYALKERVRKSKIPGQFILSGSVRFTSKKLIRESLTGRIQYLELLPCSIAELLQEPLPSAVQTLLESKNLKNDERQFSIPLKAHRLKMKALENYLTHGGLPGVLFLRNPVVRKNKIADQLRTILDRDLRQIYPTYFSYERIENFCRALASQQGMPIQYSTLQKETELTPITQQKLLNALEPVFLIRRIPIEGGKKGFVILFEDQAESYYFSGEKLNRLVQLTHLLFRNIRTEFYYRFEKDAQFFQYRTRAGVVVPLALRSNDQVIGFFPVQGPKLSHAEKASGDSFLRKYNYSKMIFFHEGTEVHAINDRMMVLPISFLL